MRILIADDHKIIRDGLRSLLEKQPDMRVVAEADNGRAALKLTQELNPDVVIMDIGMPQLNGIDATRHIHTSTPMVKIIALSMHSDKRFVAQMFQAGASAYLLKDCAFEELVQSLRAVAGGQTYISPQIAGSLVKDYVARLSQAEPSNKPQLTSREREVLQLLAEGKTSKQIAAELSIGIKTIETHRQQIMNKLSIRSIAELVKYAIREGLTRLES